MSAVAFVEGVVKIVMLSAIVVLSSGDERAVSLIAVVVRSINAVESATDAVLQKEVVAIEVATIVGVIVVFAAKHGSHVQFWR